MQLIPIERNGMRVLTTNQLADAFGADNRVISNNFNRNKDRYVEGRHYFALTGRAKTEFLNLHHIDDGSRNAATLYLWTEKGAWLHAKSLNTDLAWEAYEQLVDDYYEIKAAHVNIGNLSPQLQALIQIEQKQQELEENQLKLMEENRILKHRINTLDKVDITGDEQQVFNKMIRKYAATNGITFQKAYREFKGAYNIAYRTNTTMLHENFKMKPGKEKATLPEFLVATGRIEDAIRVVDKMLNNEEILPVNM